MSRHLELAPFAITSDGTLYINLVKLTTAATLETVVRAAKEEMRPLFIGVMLSPKQGEFAMARLDNAADEAAAHIVGQRRRRPRRRG